MHNNLLCQVLVYNYFYFTFGLQSYNDMKKKAKKDEDLEMVAFSVRLPKFLYNILSERAKDNKRSLNKESEVIFEKELV